MSTEADHRSDYDDEFAREMTPRMIVRRKLAIPAYALAIWGLFGVIGAFGGLLAGVVNYFDSRQFEDDVDALVLIAFGCFFGFWFFLLMMRAGLAMRQLRRRKLALVGSYFATSISIGGPWGLPIFPFGIWAIVLLHQSEVAAQFDLPDKPPPLPRSPRLDRDDRLRDDEPDDYHRERAERSH